MCGDFTWRVSDCEELSGILLGDCLTCVELSGGYSQEMIGWFWGKFTSSVVNMNFIVEELVGGHTQEKMGFVLQELGIDPFLS